uniref:Uncharacterized protein n=1 Tax=Anguilla anguilla TaxID=7936 RepID=A0A0E9TT83_ANGAN
MGNGVQSRCFPMPVPWRTYGASTDFCLKQLSIS